ncbi:restriction endonuclease subunit S [Ralstonia solanacearum]|uniref:restriction endonuclease subunit S n=1 Tax=Ralstonia solanacearum TaxID=305 RepID=UPI003518D152
MTESEMLDCPNAAAGQLPADWRLSKLSDIADINPGRAKPKAEDDEVSFLAMGDVSEDGQVTERQIRNYQDVAKGFTSFVENDVLVAKITPCFENGKGALATNLLNGIGFGSTEFHVIRAKDGCTLPSFLHWHTRDESFRRNGERSMVGSAGQKRVPTDFLREYKIALPPIKEQQKIVAILTTMDDKLDAIARQLEATQTLKRGLMQTLFSRGVGAQSADGQWVPHAEFRDSELGHLPASWEVRPIGALFDVVERAVEMDAAQIYRRVTVKRRFGGIELRDELPGAAIKVKNQFLVEAGDFLISERQIVHGACGVVPSALTGALVSNEYLVLKAKPEANVRYFDYMVRLLRFRKYFLLCSQGVDIEKFLFKPKDWLKKLVPVPSSEEQARIADVLALTDQKLEALTEKQFEYQTLKRGLMQKLLTGEWRVKLEEAEPLAS